MMLGIDHVNVVVVDLPRMISFYRDTLGLRVVREVTITGDWIESLTGFERVEADVAYLEADAGSGLELIRYRTPQGVRPPAAGEANTGGLRHLAFRVDGLDAMAARMRSAGVEFLSEIQQVPHVQVDFADQRKRIVYCRDPEGNLLELCEFQRI